MSLYTFVCSPFYLSEEACEEAPYSLFIVFVVHVLCVVQLRGLRLIYGFEINLPENLSAGRRLFVNKITCAWLVKAAVIFCQLCFMPRGRGFYLFWGNGTPKLITRNLSRPAALVELVTSNILPFWLEISFIALFDINSTRQFGFLRSYRLPCRRLW